MPILPCSRRAAQTTRLQQRRRGRLCSPSQRTCLYTGLKVSRKTRASGHTHSGLRGSAIATGSCDGQAGRRRTCGTALPEAPLAAVCTPACRPAPAQLPPGCAPVEVVGLELQAGEVTKLLIPRSQAVRLALVLQGSSVETVWEDTARRLGPATAPTASCRRPLQACRTPEIRSSGPQGAPTSSRERR